jgi:phospholipid transport system substrate-binding protein
MRKLLLLIVSVLLISTSLNAVTYNSDPKIFITELLNDAITALSDKSISKEKKAEVIRKIAVENVDIKALGMYTLGETRKTLDPEVLKNYNDLFQEYFLKSLTSRLNDYSTNKFEILDSEQKSAIYTIVKSKIIESSAQPEMKINWRVYTKVPTKPLIRDLIVEGLSLARTQKQEFASILNSNNNDIKILFKKLEEFISKK